MATRKRAPNQLSRERERDLISTARDLFFEEGLGRATMDRIAARARMSKTTIYRRYPNKEALFEAVITEEAAVIATELKTNVLDVERPVESLRDIALALHKIGVNKRHMEMRRLMVAEGGRYPELVFAARSKLFGAAAERLIPFLETLIKENKMRRLDPFHAVTLFGMVFSGGLRPMLNAMPDSEEEQMREFNASLDLFLRGWGLLPTHD